MAGLVMKARSKSWSGSDIGFRVYDGWSGQKGTTQSNRIGTDIGFRVYDGWSAHEGKIKAVPCHPKAQKPTGLASNHKGQEPRREEFKHNQVKRIRKPQDPCITDAGWTDE